MIQVAVYGKGGIGKSTVSANISYQLAGRGLKVVQVGCDPKHDSTRLLLGGRTQNTLLDSVRSGETDVGDVAAVGKNGVVCLEAGGPEPGIGCAGRGILTAFNFISEHDIINDDTDVVLYDVLGDVVCGGFAVPLRHRYADCVFLVTSGEFMAIYAANNVLRGIRNFDGDMARVEGIIFNSRGGANEERYVEAFADAVGLPVVERIPRSELFRTAESRGVTVSELDPGSDEASVFEGIAGRITGISEGTYSLHPARPLNDTDMQALAKGERIIGRTEEGCRRGLALNERETLRGCGSAVAFGCCWNIRDLDIVIHGPSSCSYYFRASRDRMLYLQRHLGDRPDSERVTCTDMDEHMSIFGGNEALRGKIEGMIGRGSKNIAIVTTCVPGIIGDNVRDICRELSERHGVTVIPIEADGILNGAAAQTRAVALKSILSLTIDEKPVPGVFNLIGHSDHVDPVMRNSDDVWKILDGLGIRIGCRAFDRCRLDEIRHLRRAVMNLVYDDNLVVRSISQCMEEFVQVPTYPHPLPRGLRESLDWIDGAVRDLGIDPERAEAEKRRLTDEFSSLTSDLRGDCEGAVALLFVSINTNLDWLMEACGVIGIKVAAALCPVVNKYQDEVASDSLRVPEGIPVSYGCNFDALKRKVSELNPDIVLGNIGHLADLKGPHLLFDSPPPGIRGAVEYMRRISRCVKVARL
ncbi:MAG: AAA family ATPase [Candidatus Methanomethylophilaceae archaeon]|nr:AAA family ATPase [Candidatus Methanomethylophilaceae archaeon]